MPSCARAYRGASAHCILRGCNIAERGKARRFFKFPLKNRSILIEWIQFIKQYMPEFDDNSLTKTSRLCSVHFQEDDYNTSHLLQLAMGYRKKRTVLLKKDSVPTRTAISRHQEEQKLGICDENDVRLITDDVQTTREACKEFSNSSHHEELLKMQSGYKSYQCIQCHKIFSESIINLEEHLKKYKRAIPNKCRHYEKTFLLNNNFETPMTDHMEERLYRCNYCVMAFPYKCKFCEMAFLNDLILKKHIKIHARNKSFRCGRTKISKTNDSHNISEIKLGVRKEQIDSTNNYTDILVEPKIEVYDEPIESDTEHFYESETESDSEHFYESETDSETEQLFVPEIDSSTDIEVESKFEVNEPIDSDNEHLYEPKAKVEEEQVASKNIDTDNVSELNINVKDETIDNINGDNDNMSEPTIEVLVQSGHQLFFTYGDQKIAPTAKSASGAGGSTNCILHGCTNSPEPRRFFSFPHKNEDIYAQWIEFIENCIPEFKEKQITEYSKLCNAHFRQIDLNPSHLQEHKLGFREENNVLLKTDAVPTIKMLHKGELPYQCRQCDKLFLLHNDFSTHMMDHLEDRLYRCNYCDMAFPYKCKHCDMAFLNNINLKDHMRIHAREESYQCSITKTSNSNNISKLKLRVKTKKIDSTNDNTDILVEPKIEVYDEPIDSYTYFFYKLETKVNKEQIGSEHMNTDDMSESKIEVKDEPIENGNCNNFYG